MTSEEQAVVVPLVPVHEEPNTETMLRMLLAREALVIQRTARTPNALPSDMVAQSTGAFAKAIGQATGNLGSSTRVASDLYRVILPAGATARDLVPAVGGGFRGLVRTSGAAGITGQATLMPAALGAGATIAAGPLIATVALAVGAEMLAQHQTNKKLAAISSAVIELTARLDEKENAVLTTAAQQSSKVASYLLDRAHIPSISSAAHAFGDLDTLTNSYIAQLDRWTESVAVHENSERVYAPDLLKALVGKRDNPLAHFETMVARTYEALALRARVVVLEKVAAEFSNGDRSLPHVEAILREELRSLANRQTQLTDLLDDLAVLPTDASKAPIAFAGKGTLAARTSFSRLSRALHSAPDSVPLLTSSDHSIIELAPSASGFDVLTPSEP